MSWSYNPRFAETNLVWALPRSLATTNGITIVFSSSAYLDVSVQRVRLFRYHAFNMMGCPIRISADQHSCAAPRSFSQLITSFIAFESLGIPHTPFAYLSLNSCLSKSKPLVFLFILLLNLRLILCFLRSYLLLLVNIISRLNMSKNFLLWRISESNRWPPACKAGALASWANSPIAFLKN